jgi:putative transposase
METRYAKNAGAVFALKYHLVWCPKYRRPVLVGKVEKRLRALLKEKAAEIELQIHALEIMPDHVHLFVESDPRWCVAEIAARLKGFTSHQLRAEFASLRSRLPTLWSRSYFAATVGSVTEAAVKKYIAGQKGS